MNKITYGFFLFALYCISCTVNAVEEQQEEINPDIEIALEYNKMYSKKNDAVAIPKISPGKIRFYTGAVLVALLVYRAADVLDDAQ